VLAQAEAALNERLVHSQQYEPFLVGSQSFYRRVIGQVAVQDPPFRQAASLLLILTDVDAVYAGWGTPEQRPLRQLSVSEGERMDREGAFGEGSMAPKIRAAMDFVRRTGGRAIITELSRGREAVRGEAGTTITGEKVQS
jgi:carbamate kinase